MKTSTEIRRENLNILIERYGSIANLNAQLGRNRKDATLSDKEGISSFRYGSASHHGRHNGPRN